MLDGNVSPAADQPDSRAIGQLPLLAVNYFDWRPYFFCNLQLVNWLWSDAKTVLNFKLFFLIPSLDLVWLQASLSMLQENRKERYTLAVLPPARKEPPVDSRRQRASFFSMLSL
eukprot:483779-Pelagomonas_calceolata.AAC.1